MTDQEFAPDTTRGSAFVNDGSTPCPECGRAPGPKGRIRHDEFCPNRATAPRATSGGEPAPATAATGRAPRTRGRSARLSEAEIARGINDGIILVQSLVLPARPDLAPDALTQRELDLLAPALAEEIYTHRRLREIVEKIMRGGGGHARLIYAMVIIALPRMQRRGMLPGGMVAQSGGGPFPTETAPPFHSSESQQPNTNGHVALPPVMAASSGDYVPLA